MFLSPFLNGFVTVLVDTASHTRQRTGWVTHFYVEWHNHTAAFSAQITSSRRRKNCFWLLWKCCYDDEVVDETFILHLNGKLWRTIIRTGNRGWHKSGCFKIELLTWLVVGTEIHINCGLDSWETVQTVFHLHPVPLDEASDRRNIASSLSPDCQKTRKNLKIRKRNKTPAWKNVNASINPSLSVRT